MSNLAMGGNVTVPAGGLTVIVEWTRSPALDEIDAKLRAVPEGERNDVDPVRRPHDDEIFFDRAARMAEASAQQFEDARFRLRCFAEPLPARRFGGSLRHGAKKMPPGADGGRHGKIQQSRGRLTSSRGA